MEKYLASLKSGELPERTPSEHDLDILTRLWMKTRLEVSIDQEENEKLKEVLQKELNTTEYFDAVTPPGTPPLATSVKKPMLGQLTVEKKSNNSDISDSKMSSVSSSINTMCSPEMLKKQAERKITKVRKALKNENMKEEALKTP